MKTKQIINGWMNSLKAGLNVLDKNIQDKAEKRSLECFKCEKFVSHFNLPISGAPVGYHCKVCKCLYPALVLAEEKECPLGKW